MPKKKKTKAKRPMTLDEFLGHRPVALVLSILLALIIWFAVIMNVYPSTPVRFYNIPVQVDLSGTNAEANGLSVVDCDVQTVNVELIGNRSQIGNLTADDLVAYADVGAISTTGQFTMNLDVKSETGISFTVDKIEPSTASVKLDKIETRTFDVEPSFPNIKIASGHTMYREDVTCEPSTIDITGPSSQLAEIGKVVVYSNKTVEISSSYAFYSSDVQLYTDEGARLDTDSIDIPSVEFQINIPILTEKELELTYDLIGVPSSFTKDDQEWLRERLKLSEESITIASMTNTALADSLSVGYVRLNEVGLDYSATMDITLEEGYKNQSGIQQVTLALDSEGLSSRSFRVNKDNISIINQPNTYDFTLVTKWLDISVVGDKETLDSLEADDIIVTVDLLNFDAEQYPSESFTTQASISFYQKGKIWAIGAYRIALNRQDIVSSEEQT